MFVFGHTELVKYYCIALVRLDLQKTGWRQDEPTIYSERCTVREINIRDVTIP